LLAAIRVAFGTLRTRRDLCRGGLRKERTQRKQSAHRFEQLHFRPERRIGWQSVTTRRIKSSAFSPREPNARCAENTSRKYRHDAQTAAGAPCEGALVLFRYTGRQN
jgi:hypothetical protein